MKGVRAIIFKHEVMKEGEIMVIWNQMSNYISRIAKELLRELKGKRHFDKET